MQKNALRVFAIAAMILCSGYASCSFGTYGSPRGYYQPPPPRYYVAQPTYYYPPPRYYAPPPPRYYPKRRSPRYW